MTTTVINIRNAPEGWESDRNYRYCGRPYTRGGYDLSGSVFANPFVIGRDGDRDECIKKFKHLIQYECRELFDRAKHELCDLILVCWCKPKPCHVDIVADIANGKLEFLGATHASV